MAVMNDIKKVTKGANLAQPKLSLSWILPAIVACAILVGTWKAGNWLFDRFEQMAAPVTSKVTQTAGAAAGHATEMFYLN